jgi:hypothetical protein
MKRLALGTLAAAVVAAAGGAGQGAAPPVLVAKTGFRNLFGISLTFPNDGKVTTLPAGTHTLVVHDYSRIHNFALGSRPIALADDERHLRRHGAAHAAETRFPARRPRGFVSSYARARLIAAFENVPDVT